MPYQDKVDQYKNIPYELKELDRWGCFKFVKNKDPSKKDGKFPIDAKTGMEGNSADSSTWSSFDVAVEQSKNYNGGIIFYLKKPYVGIDLDDVPEDIEKFQNGDHENIVGEFIDMLGSYAEISPSGNGIHILMKGEFPDEWGNRVGNVEMYTQLRLLTFTGNTIGGNTHIADDRDGELAYLHNSYIGKKKTKKPKNNVVGAGNTLSEQEVIEKGKTGKNSLRFNSFYDGTWEQLYTDNSGSPDTSRADLGFANDLAFWTNRDFNKMKNIMYDSPMYREKWDSSRGDSTWINETIQMAINDCKNAFMKDEFGLLVEQNVENKDDKVYSYDDTGNGERFSDNYNHLIRYNYDRKIWYYYDGVKWEGNKEKEASIRKLQNNLLKDMVHEEVFKADDVDDEDAIKFHQKHIKYSRGTTAKNKMLSEAQPLLSVSIQDFDENPSYLNVQNGVLDLDTGELKEHDSEMLLTKVAAAEYTRKINHPIWDRFLYQIFDGDVELIKYVQRAVGYSLSSDITEHKMFFLYGKGRNGKSVFLNTIGKLLSDYSINIEPDVLMSNSGGGRNADQIARLHGARFLISSETNEDEKFNENLIKRLTGGDSITARHLYEGSFDFHPVFKLWMQTNNKPTIIGKDDGIWRRFAIIPFNMQIPLTKVDKRLSEKLENEMSGILKWAVEGYQEWKEIGLAEPDIVKKEVEKYRKEMNILELFFEEMTITGENEEVKAEDLFIAYDNWVDNFNFKEHKKSSQKFYRDLKESLGEENQSRIDGKRSYNGIGLRNKQKYNNVFSLNRKDSFN